MATLNDVMDFAKFYTGVDEPPRFFHEYFDLKDKLFVASDDFKLAQKLTDDTKENAVLHYFEHDTKQNRLLLNNLADKKLHRKAFAVASPDFSADSKNCWSCFNISNILKSRICAYRWQSECEEAVILTLLWGDESTYKMAFSNVEKGSVVAISSQAIENIEIFRNGFIQAVKMIEPENICWYGKVFDWVSNYYDTSKIIQMQTRTDLLKMYKQTLFCESQKSLF